jgi:acetyl esterase/lipase
MRYDVCLIGALGVLAFGGCADGGTVVDTPVAFLDQQYSIAVEPGIVYATGAVRSPAIGNKDLLLDLYRPVGPDAPTLRPALVLVHASFVNGSRTRPNEVAFASAYARRGYVSVSIDFREPADDPPTEHLAITPSDPVSVAAAAARVDAARAVDWVRANAAVYGIDPDRIAMGGHSAGGITSLGVAYRGPGEDGALVQAVLSMSGGLYGTESFIDVGDPPLILLHGTADPTVLFSHAQAIVSRADAVGLPYEFYPLEGVGHQLFPELGRVVDGATLEQRIANFFYLHLDLEGL